MNTLRTEETEQKYKDYLENEYDGACIFCQCNQKIYDFKYWILHSQKFPYDNFGVKIKSHYMLAPKRHIQFEIELNQDEREELSRIETFGVWYIEEEGVSEQLLDYDMRIINNKIKQSVPQHLHYHYIKFDNN